MHFKHTDFLRFLIAGLVVVILMGCQSATPNVRPTLTALVAPTAVTAPTQASQAEPGGYPAPGTGEMSGYPVDGSATSVPLPEPEGYPAPGDGTGPASGAPVVENRAKVTGTLIEKAPDANNASFTRLHVQVLTAEDVDGLPNFARDLVNNESDLFIETVNLPVLNPNDRFEALVAYDGDESGGRFYVLEIKKLE